METFRTPMETFKQLFFTGTLLLSNGQLVLVICWPFFWSDINQNSSQLTHKKPMVRIQDGNSEISAHGRSDLAYLIL